MEFGFALRTLFFFFGPFFLVLALSFKYSQNFQLLSLFKAFPRVFLQKKIKRTQFAFAKKKIFFFLNFFFFDNYFLGYCQQGYQRDPWIRGPQGSRTPSLGVRDPWDPWVPGVPKNFFWQRHFSGEKKIFFRPWVGSCGTQKCKKTHLRALLSITYLFHGYFVCIPYV